MATELHVTEHARLEKTIAEADEHIKRLEQERRELTQTQGSRRAAISALEEKCETLQNHLRTANTDLNKQKIMYGQIK